MHLSRVRTLRQGSFVKGPIVYWMDRDMRFSHNWALIYAQSLAEKYKEPLVVVYNFVPQFLGGGERQVRFKMQGLDELQSLAAEKNIAFFVLVDKTGSETPDLLLDFCKKVGCGTLVTDFSPLRIQRKWKASVAQNIKVPFFEVDAHNIVPAWLASPKQEFGAYTLRPKLHRLLPQFLDTFPPLRKQKIIFNKKIAQKNLAVYKNNIQEQEDPFFVGGQAAAHAHLRTFFRDNLEQYGENRNRALLPVQSNLSPYLHYGMISAQWIALETLRVSGFSLDQLVSDKENTTAVFLEELIVRRELADNFCLYNKNYDRVQGFPAWAQKTLAAHTKDKREYLYTKKQFEHAKTHDELWNAAQREMVRTGKMHGYMRMYWAKKILEWTPNPEVAMKIAIHLNDTYELDGRDPNGYAGIAWSIGGVHDRAWFERPIYGLIRYMARSGCEKKFDVQKYIEKFS